MIAIIRIRGLVGVNKNIDETLYRLRLRKKFSCVVLPEKKEILSMIKRVENFVAYGKIEDKTLDELIEKRGKVVNKKKLDVKKVVEEMQKGKIESIKPFFRLHPPRGGINSKEHFPKGVLGKNEKINELIKRML